MEMATSSISTLLLQGWNPLMKNPKSNEIICVTHGKEYQKVEYQQEKPNLEAKSESIPLVKNKQNIEKCVVCGSNYVNEADAAHLNLTPKQPAKAVDSTDQQAGYTIFEKHERSNGPSTEKGDRKTTGPTDGHKYTCSRTSSTCRVVVERTTRILEKKLNYLTDVLESTTDLSKISEILSLINDCASTIQKISQL
ncbi:hypothetical protein AX774_g36 [Zancudomyces culisetae]|uniref:Uncharacterized protein n=1 Tax=Zancudomyces culisetae TaxID=1213189 RepID=A0A1R1PZL9_ZANCU|nr:hypothetical protein AX774_g36 [Zancudomyces culisetae]|eukprot:OMH86389.1 hypothetical protein AX774_g36 [Zancudomyces culisetae]